MTYIAAIAAGLSEAQRRMLIRLVDQGSMRSQYADMRTVSALDKRGLTGAGQDSWTYEGTVLPLPLAYRVRAHLAALSKEQGGG